MAKKDFKKGITNLFKETMETLHNLIDSKELEKIDLNKIDNEQLKWLLLQLKRYDKELHFWRTGKLTPEKFHQTLKEHNLKYNPETNSFELLTEK